MSSFWSGWVWVLTVGNILACWWLIRWTMKNRAGEAASGDVTGHVWDGTLEEYNNPLPRWWLWLFYGTMIFAAVYLAIYGVGNWRGLTNWSETGAYEAEMAKAEAEYGPVFAKYAKTPIPALAADPEAVKTGRHLFLTYCMQCHGSDAQGARGFPNLADNDWLWGGTPEKIEETILNGRQAAMPSWKPILGEDGVDKAANYVASLAGHKADPAKAEEGKKLFQTNCAACHGMDGKGNPMLGAPNLTDKTWLYGGTLRTIKKTIAGGRTGKMPAHKDLLGKDKVHVLAGYVYSLSHGG